MWCLEILIFKNTIQIFSVSSSSPLPPDRDSAINIKMAEIKFPSETIYSKKYQDAHYEYRIVTLNEDAFKKRKEIHHFILKECEWRGLGIKQSHGWEHTGQFQEEPHVLGFRRLIGTNPETGSPPKKPLVG